MKTSIQLPAEVAAARSKFDRAREERERILGAIALAKDAVRQAEAEHAAAEVRLAASESAGALGAKVSPEAGRKAFLEARNQRDFAAAKISGLEASLLISNDDCESARKEIMSRWADWVKGVETELASDYERACAEFMGVVDRLLMAGEALALGRVIMAMRKTIVSGDAHGSKQIVRSGPLRSQWRKSPQLLAEYLELAGLRHEALGDLEVSATSLVAASADRDSESSDTAVPIFSRGGLRL